MKLVLASRAHRAIWAVPILFTRVPLAVITSAPTTTRSTSFITLRTAESTISSVSMPILSSIPMVVMPWNLGRDSVAITLIFFPDL